MNFVSKMEEGFGLNPDERRFCTLVDRGLKEEADEAEQKRQQAILDDIEAKALRPYLKAELAAEMNTGGTRDERRRDIEALDAYAREWGLTLDLPRNPAHPVLVAAFLAQESEHGLKHLKRLHRSISFSYRCLNLPDPTADIIVSAVVRSVRAGNSKSPHNGKGH
jgi:hypothetical protein